MKRKLTYSMEIDTLHDIDYCGRVTMYYSKGHHEPNAFVDEAAKEHDVIVNPDHVQHKYMRWEMFAGPDGPCHVGAISEAPGRGKFPVTFAEEWEEIA